MNIIITILALIGLVTMQMVVGKAIGKWIGRFEARRLPVLTGVTVRYEDNEENFASVDEFDKYVESFGR